MAEDSGLSLLGRGARVLFRQSEQSGWQLGMLEALNGASVQVTTDAGTVLECPSANVHPANGEEYDGSHDLCQLNYLTEATVLHNLNTRFGSDEIYTFAGPVLIALNPCKQLPLYTPEVAARYTGGTRSLDLQFGNLTISSNEPHIYLVSAKAFQAMVRDNASQSLVVSGESGAGKTETTKKAMQYFTTLAGGTGIEDQVMETNPILEAFGNAKTSRNHNSSRFGKLIKIHFNHTHHIAGASISTYLLEKSRVVAQLPGERSYHIFYQLVRGAGPQLRAALHLPDAPEAFRYLAASGCTEIAGVDDGKDFEEVEAALRCVGILEEQQGALMRLVAAVMWLGNLDIASAADGEGSQVARNEALAHAAELLGVGEEALEEVLTQRSITTPEGVLKTRLSAEAAADTRDALAKALYSALFNWLVEQVNQKLEAGKRAAGLHIAILDIFGFEDFTTNSFEQLCINYTNERLQQQFNTHLFTLQQQEYKEEGVGDVRVDFEDNAPTVSLLEARQGKGILSVLDSQCAFPRSTDASFIDYLRASLPHPRLAFDRRDNAKFVVHHYAGPVAYHTAGFLEKNRDTLSPDLVDLMQASGLPLLQQLGQAVAATAGGGKGRQTVAGRFAGQLGALVSELDASGLHFIRCIKPNPGLAPGDFQQDMVLQQLRCCGVLEVVRLAKAGFPARYLFDTFATRYSVLAHREQKPLREGETARDAVVRLLDELELEAGVRAVGPDDYLLGHSKVFFRAGVVGKVEAAWAKAQRMAALLQSLRRTWRLRTAFAIHRRAAIAFQAAARGRAARVAYAEEQRRHAAAARIQRAWRSRKLLRTWLQAATAILVIQKYMRRWIARKELLMRKHAQKRRELEARLAAEEARRQEESFSALQAKYGLSLQQVREAVDMYINNSYPAPPPASSSSSAAPLPTAPTTPWAATTPAPSPVIASPTRPRPRFIIDTSATDDVDALPFPTPTASDPAPAPSDPSDPAASDRAAANPAAGGAAPLSELMRLRLQNMVLAHKVKVNTTLREEHNAYVRDQAVAALASQVRVLQGWVEDLCSRHRRAGGALVGPLSPDPPEAIDVNAVLRAVAATEADERAAAAAAAAPAVQARHVDAAAGVPAPAVVVQAGTVEARREQLVAGVGSGGGGAGAEEGARRREEVRGVGESLVEYQAGRQVAAAEEEFEEQSGRLQDDANFIKETSQSQEPGRGYINLEAELHKLELRYEVWTGAFAETLKDVRRLLGSGGSGSEPLGTGAGGASMGGGAGGGWGGKGRGGVVKAIRSKYEDVSTKVISKMGNMSMRVRAIGRGKSKRGSPGAPGQDEGPWHSP